MVVVARACTTPRVEVGVVVVVVVVVSPKATLAPGARALPWRMQRRSWRGGGVMGSLLLSCA